MPRCVDSDFTCTRQVIEQTAEGFGLAPEMLEALMACFAPVAQGPFDRTALVLDPYVFHERLVFNGLDPSPFVADWPTLCTPERNGPLDSLFCVGRFGLSLIEGWVELRSVPDDEKALALQSVQEACRYGRFGQWGYTYRDCGYPDVAAFIDALDQGESVQLCVWLAWLNRHGLLRWLQDGAVTSESLVEFVSGYLALQSLSRRLPFCYPNRRLDYTGEFGALFWTSAKLLLLWGGCRFRRKLERFGAGIRMRLKSRSRKPQP